MTLRRVLIANRGEVALRIARACSELEIECVAAHAAEDEAFARRVPCAARAALPGAGARAYLDIAAVVAAAQQHGCDAVHPGYGFLSESAAFARACAQAGLVFIGPDADALALLGDKAAARGLAQQLQVPVAAGTAGPASLIEVQDFLAAQPPGGAIVIKALAGGGGRGMRVVQRADECAAAYAVCQREALASFGLADVFAEAFMAQARHLEVQIVGDGSGAVQHLGERECSLQRQHQKLVEFAPSPWLPPAQRAALCDAALRMAAALRYRGLGTFEFLLDGARPERFIFIEANPRLQVEHTVTEEVWGVDLVQMQLRLFGGETLASLGLPQVASPSGCAMQLRINAETLQPDGSAHGAPGTLISYRPAAGPGVRVDGYAGVGDRLGLGFDSLLAKLIVRSPDRATLLRRARRALDEFVVAGVATNLGLLRALLQHPDLSADAVHTRWIDEHAAALIAAIAPDSAASQAVIDVGPGAAPASRGQAEVDPADEGLLPLRTPMPGVLIAIDVQPGDALRAGQQVALLESMKMEHVLRADQAGRVARVAAQVGDTLDAGALLLLMAPLAGDELPAEVAESEDPQALRADLTEVQQRQSLALDAQRSAAIAKRHAQGGRSARENVADLCDDGSFVEYGSLAVAAQRSRRSMDDLRRSTAADGVITGVGTVNAALFGAPQAACSVIAYDYTVLAGTQGFIGHAKQDRLLDVAGQLKRPLVLFAEGGGGRPGDTDEELRVVAGLHLTTFARFAQLSGAVPLVGIVHGRCFAGNAALLGCCDVIIATRSATIGMGGPAMIEGGGLGVVAPDEVGPVSVQGPNGVIDVLVDDEAQAVAQAKRYLSYFQGRLPSWACADQQGLRRLIPENRLRVYDIRAVIHTLADTDSVLELRQAYAPGMVTALVRFEGRPLGLIANNPAHLGGAIDAQGADKASRFLELCDAFDLPVLSLCDTPGFMVGPAIEREAMVRRCCRLFVTGANLEVPLFTVVLRKGYGLGAMAMAGGSFHAPLFNVSWPSGEFGGMGLEGAVRLGYRNELAAIADPAQREAEYRRLVDAQYTKGKAINTASLLEIDNVIDPADTRRWLLRLHDSLPPRPAARSGKKRAHIDTW